MRIFRCTLTLLERTFFSSREQAGNFYSDGTARRQLRVLLLCHGLVAPRLQRWQYRYYGQHLSQLNEAGIYVTQPPWSARNHDSL